MNPKQAQGIEVKSNWIKWMSDGCPKWNGCWFQQVGRWLCWMTHRNWVGYAADKRKTGFASWVSGSGLQKQRKSWLVSSCNQLLSTKPEHHAQKWVGTRKLGCCYHHHSTKDAALLLPKWILNHSCFFGHFLQMSWQEGSNGTSLNHM